MQTTPLTPFLDEAGVALDLETTGLDSEQDAIIEVGAVKFRSTEVLDTFRTFVNPYQPVPEFVQRLTGISQQDVDRAPSFDAVAGQLSDFVGSLPIVAHNINFDLTFLSKHGLTLSNQAYDTWDLAAALLPRFADYSLARLAGHLGLVHPRPHRALPDAQTVHVVLLALLERARSLDAGVAEYIHHLASWARWPSGSLLSQVAQGRSEARTGVGPRGLDLDSLASRMRRQGSVRPSSGRTELDEEELAAALGPDGLFSRSFPGFEHRPQQVEMLRAVVKAFNQGTPLMAEGGTGVGKSLAYLLPAVLFSVRNGARVVVSTNTINLQEQLLQKDIPALVQVLEDAGMVAPGEFRAVPLKGRANYLCLRRWSHLAQGDNLSPEEARLLSKCLVWLQDTDTGDRSEVNLAGRDSHLWSRVSAGERGACPGSREGPCFLRASRERAEAAHVVVVNHALLLSDLASGGSVLPDYRYLIVDEAHHLEEEATRQLGFQIAQGGLNEHLDTLGRLFTEVRVLLRGAPSRGQAALGEDRVASMEGRMPRVREAWTAFWGAAERFLHQHARGSDDRPQVSLDRAARAQPAWSELEIVWENVDVSLAEAVRLADALRGFVSELPSAGPLDPETVGLELEKWLAEVEELRKRLSTLMSAPLRERIDWMTQDGSDGNLVLHSAPLNVAPELQKSLFGRKECVVLTSATLSSQGSFAYLHDRVGLADADELIVGSPFDYRQAALLLLPDDIPDPNQWGYQDAVAQVVAGLGQALEGHTMALFTSHAALRATAQAVRPRLEAHGLKVLAQGIDGPPRRLLQDFAEDSRCVLLGTSSFWEGVDLAGGILRALVVARLPFHVPTEPIFAARSELYEDAFNQYALPQAVLRLRQGVGRLIRGSGDRGAIVVLDRRIASMSYGRAFLSSIPPYTEKRVPLSAVPSEAARWVGR